MTEHSTTRSAFCPIFITFAVSMSALFMLFGIPIYVHALERNLYWSDSSVGHYCQWSRSTWASTFHGPVKL